MIYIIVKLNRNAVIGDKQVNYLNKLEKLFPKEVKKSSRFIIKIYQKRISKIKALKRPLPNYFKNYGSIVIRDYYFDTVITRLNYIISNQYNHNNYNHIKNEIRTLMTSVNHADKHVIALQDKKVLLLRIIKELKTSAHYNNLSQTINIVIHLISQCLVLNQEAYHDYYFLIQRFKRTH